MLPEISLKTIWYDERPIFSKEYENQVKELLEFPFVQNSYAVKKHHTENNHHVPAYHYINAVGFMNDPNGFCYYNGHNHLFYQQCAETTIYWEHAVSRDLVRWFELPYAIYPGPEEQSWSGTTCVEKDRVSNIYYGQGLDSGMILREALESAVREGLIPKNPADGTSPPKIHRKEKQVLTKDQLETFMKLIEGDEEWYDFFYTEIITGMRQGEICGLRWEDFDEEKGTLRVARSVDFVHKELIIGETKTEDGKRTIYLPDSLWRLLAERKKKSFSDWIFPNLLKPELPLNPSRAYRQLKKLLEIGGLPGIRFHDLRHTFTSHAANSGIAPKTLSEIVGHSKASFTLDTYAHVTGDMQKNAAKIITNYLTDILGKGLKPWQSAEKQAKER